MKKSHLIIGLLSVMSCPFAHSAAYLPASDNVVLERLPMATAERQVLREFRVRLEENPADYGLAVDVAKDYIRIGRSQSDPRFYGYAEAVLEPWLKPPHKLPEAMVLQATILQNRHEFEAALAVLNNALNLNPKLPQAWLTQSAIYEARGDYPAALRSCMALNRYSRSLTAIVCLHSALSLAGQARPSYQFLTALDDGQMGQEERTWFYNLLAELAERLALNEDAEKWYRKALDTGVSSVYLLASYADFLLDHNRQDEVVTILREHTRADVLLLRLTLAEQRLRSASYYEHVGVIRDRMAAAKARGDKVHQGDEARYYLHVANDAEIALNLASENWLVQKEPRDARILLEAAIAANRKASAMPVIEFMEKNRLEDRRLLPLIKVTRG